MSNPTLRRIPISPNDDYRAGSDGQIYSRTRYAGWGRKERVPWYPLVGYRGTKGYLLVSMSHKNKRVTRSVHRLVCMAFHGEPDGRLEVRHLDGDKKNNTPSNLRWGTAIENWQDRRAHGRARDRGEHHSARFTNEDRGHIAWAVSMGLCSRRHVARVLGVAASSIIALCEREARDSG